jgi:hypothetical protein
MTLLQKQIDKDGETITFVGIFFVLINLHDKERANCRLLCSFAKALDKRKFD